MKKRTITYKEAETLCKEIEIPTNHPPVVWVEKHTADIKDWNGETNLMPAFIVDERFLCLWDISYGRDIVVDLKMKEVYGAKYGVFQPEWIFLSDYYGYSEGAFFYRV